jgi:D-glycero-alpha-D-manno-heptose-7-phosphate kinase
MTFHLTVSAPRRIDLAGGTLDIWPLWLFHEGALTVNVAIDRNASCSFSPRADGKIVFVSRDTGQREEFASFAGFLRARRYRLPLLARLVRFFQPRGLAGRRGFTLTTDSLAPAGAGLGGSSALNIALCALLNRLTRSRYSAGERIAIARNVEAQVIEVPTGEQDYYPATFGGAQAIHLSPAGVRREPLALDEADWNRRFVLCYTGKPRQSGINNWEVMKAHLEGDRRLRRNFDRLAEIARGMRTALLARDWKLVAEVLREEWRHRRRNHPGITTAQIERLMRVARQRGALAGKVCGAGGGGCVFFLIEPGTRREVERALMAAGARILPFAVARKGVQVQSRVEAR